MEIKVGDIVYYARILPELSIYELLELKIRTAEENWFVGCELKSHATFLFNKEDFQQTVFTDRGVTLRKVKEAKKGKEVE